LVHRVPYPPDKGDRIRSFHLLKHLSRLGRVRLAAFADEAVAADSLEVVEGLTERTRIVPVDDWRWMNAAARLAMGKSATEGLFSSSTMERALEHWVSEIRFDVGVAFCSSMAPFLERLPIPRKFVDLVDVDSEKFVEYAANAGFIKRTLYALEAKRLRA